MPVRGPEAANPNWILLTLSLTALGQLATVSSTRPQVHEAFTFLILVMPALAGGPHLRHSRLLFRVSMQGAYHRIHLYVGQSRTSGIPTPTRGTVFSALQPPHPQLSSLKRRNSLLLPSCLKLTLLPPRLHLRPPTSD
jgi:hypothetical protein